MLQKRHRLTTTAFDHAFATGKRSHDRAWQLIMAPSQEFHGAAVVGKKVYKKAVDRNRLRRQLYAVLYQYYQKSGVTGTYIVIAKPVVATLSQRERKHVLQNLRQSLARQMPVSTEGHDQGTIPRPH